MSETKKLSLEERLNLAAQKRRRPKKHATSSAEDLGAVTMSSSKESIVDAIDSELEQWMPEDISGIDRADLIKILDQHFVEFKQSYKGDNKSSNDVSVLKLVKGKDEEIDQLKKNVEKYERQENLGKLKIGKLKEAMEIATSSRDQLTKELNLVVMEKDSLVSKLKEAERNIALNSEEMKSLNEQRRQVKDLENILEAEREQSQQLTAELEGLRSKIDNQKLEFRNETAKNEKISNELITSLESQLEQLRIELENKNNEETEQNGAKDDHYTLLKDQFQSSKSNWSSIESILNGKINTLEDSVENYREKVIKLENLLERKSSDLLKIESILEEERNCKRSIEERYESLEKSSICIKKEFDILKEDYNLLEKKYEAQRNNYKKKSNLQNLGSTTEGADGNHWNDFSTEIHSAEGIEDQIDKISVGNINDSGILGNSNIDVLQINDESSLDHFHSKHSDIDFPEDADALEEMNLHDRSFRKLSTQFTNTGQTNTHLVTKLGNEIRRLENEIISSNEKIEKLKKEKSSANEEILRLMEEKNEFDNNEVVNAKIKLEKRVKELEEKLDATLQILGEKTEKVDELQNDVLDLKDMLHEQVKQMVELQDKLR
uniref:Uncharacterized protein yjr134C n=1 Tax=Nakaseomyces delphensis TaxID=51657 RepID=A7WPE2_NAKDE|nr:hypothetical protein [Nakaseomyces delphensis]